MRSHAVTLTLALLVPLQPAFAGWSVETAAAPRQTEFVAMRPDPSGAPLFVFGFNELFAASWNGAAYDVESIDDLGCIGGVDAHASIAFDPVTGEPLVAYQAAGRGSDIRLARRVAGAWAVESIPGFAYEDSHTALEVTAGGTVYLAWRSQWDAVLRLAIGNGGGWSVEEVDADGGRPAMTLIGAEPVIVYPSRAGEVRAAFRNAGVWSYETVETVQSSFSPSIALRPGGEPVVSYWDPTILASPELHVASRAAGVWTVETVDIDIDQASAIAVDAAGNPSVVYRDAVLDRVELARFDGVAWQLEVVDPAVIAGYGKAWLSLAFDAADNPHVAYVDQGTHQVRYATRAVPVWDIAVVDDVFGFAGWHLAMARDAADVPAVAHYDNYAQRIDLVRRTPPGWTAETVVDDLATAGSLDLAYDSKGHPSIAFFEEDVSLWLATHDGVAWSFEIVDAPSPLADAHGSVALAFEPATGNPVLAARYRSGSSEDYSLVWHVRTGGVWSAETLISGSGGFDPWRGLPPQPPSIAFDASLEPAVGFYTFDLGSVRVVRRVGGVWLESTVDDTLDFYATEVSIGFDSAGELLVAYRKGPPDHEAMLARGDGVGPWALETIAVVDRWQRGMSLGVSSGGLPVVGYHGLDTTFLNSFDGVAWNPELVDPYSPNADRASLSLDRVDEPCFAYQVYCRGHLRVVCQSNKGKVHRVGVGALFPGWKAGVLPLDSVTGDPTPPFPLDVDYPGAGADSDVTTDPLTLYRVTSPGDVDTGNRLWLVNGAGGIELIY